MPDEENKKIACHHGVSTCVIALLLGFILIVLVFKAGMLMSGSKSHFSSYRTSNYHKNLRGHLMGGEFSDLMDQKRAKIEAFEAKAESMGMTIKEYKEYLVEQLDN